MWLRRLRTWLRERQLGAFGEKSYVVPVGRAPEGFTLEIEAGPDRLRLRANAPMLAFLAAACFRLAVDPEHDQTLLKAPQTGIQFFLERSGAAMAEGDLPFAVLADRPVEADGGEGRS